MQANTLPAKEHHPPPGKTLEELDAAVIRFCGDSGHRMPMTRLTRDAVAGLGLSTKEAGRCKNFFALGLVYWLYDRDSKPTEKWINDKFKKSQGLADANLRALKGGYNYGYSVESFPK